MSRTKMEKPVQNFEKASKCPICLSLRIQAFKKGTFDYARLNQDQIKITDSEYGKIWNLSKCTDCGHIFADPFPKPEFIFSLYSQVEDPVYDDEAEGRSRNFLGILKNLEKIRPAKGMLFDVGAATGILLNLARRRRWEVGGIEASDWAVKFAFEKYNIRIRAGFFGGGRPSGRLAQALTMVDFIEHTPKPREALAKARESWLPAGSSAWSRPTSTAWPPGWPASAGGTCGPAIWLISRAEASLCSSTARDSRSLSRNDTPGRSAPITSSPGKK